MGKALAEASAEARAVFQEVDEALGQNLFKLMTEGPADELQLTENAQPAIMANAIAVFRALQGQAGDVPVSLAYVAGHSLGEYSALCAAGSIDLATTARLLKLRGQAMQAAVPVGEGAMAALLGILTGLLAFIPNLGALISGILMALVGFSVGVETGIAAIIVYFVVQTFDGYVVIPMIARKTVDLPPALVLGAQLIMGILFGIIGLLLADPLLAMLKVALVRRSEANEAAQAAESAAERALGEPAPGG